MNIFLTILNLLLLAIPAMALDKADLERMARRSLKADLTDTERADSARRAVATYCLDSLILQKEGEEVFREIIIPWMNSHDVAPRMKGFIYDNLGQIILHGGAPRANDATEFHELAIKNARECGDLYLLATILYHRAFVEVTYLDPKKGFELASQSADTFKKEGKGNVRKIVQCYYLKAIVALQLDDLNSIKTVCDNMEAAAATAPAKDRTFCLYQYMSVKDVYLDRLSEQQGRSKALKDSINNNSLKILALVESDPEFFCNSTSNPAWNYYNRAAYFVNNFSPIPVDSVELYLDKMLSWPVKAESTLLEEKISAAKLRAEMWTKLGSYSKATAALTEALNELDNIKDMNMNGLLIDRMEIFKNLRTISEEMGHYEEALAYSDSVTACEHRRYDMQLAEAVKDSEAKYKTQETALALSQSEARRARTLAWLIGAAALLLLGIVIFLIYAARQRRRRMAREVEFANLRADIGRQLTEQYIEGLEGERQRMARELHDGVCNDLLAVQMCLPDDQAKLLDACRESVRCISHELMPPEFAYANLDEVVRYYINKQAPSTPRVEYHSSASDWASVPDATALEVYRIIQEAVGNAIKHSGADLITVDMTLCDRMLRVEISDNGKFTTTGRRGQGLASMRRRASSIRGELTTEHSEKGGTNLILMVQL